MDADSYSNLKASQQRAQREKWRAEAEWKAKDLPAGAVIFGLRARAHQAKVDASRSMGMLFLSVVAGLAYFVVLPIIEDRQARNADSVRAIALDRIEAEDARIDLELERLKTSAEQVALDLWRSQLPLPTLESVSFVDAQTGWAVGEDGLILATVDGGATWEPQDSGFSQSLYGIHFVDSSTGWAVGSRGLILNTSDGGGTWIEQESASIATLYSVDFDDAKTGWVVGDEGTILVTADGGEIWQEQSALSGRDKSSWFISVAFGDAQVGWIVAWPGFLYFTVNGGDDWKSAPLVLTSSPRAVDVADSRVAWLVGDEGRVWITNDGGEQWRERPSDTLSTLNDVDFANATRGWAVGFDGAIVATSDGGEVWIAQESGTSETLASVHFVDDQTGWAVGTRRTILATTDGGLTWRDQSLPLPSGPPSNEPWVGFIIRAATTPTQLQLALVDAPEDFALSVEQDAALDALLEAELALAEARANLPAPASNPADRAIEAASTRLQRATTAEEAELAQRAFASALQWQSQSSVWWRGLDARIPAGVLLLFLLATLSSLYRYNVRIAGFYHARADALELIALDWPPDQEGFDRFATTLASEGVEFKAAKTPADMATEITKAVVGKLNLKPGGSGG